MKCFLFPQIFMSSVQQMLMDLSSNKLYIWSQLPGNNLNLSNKVSTETHCFFHKPFWILILLFPNETVSFIYLTIAIFKFPFSIQNETIDWNRRSETACRWGEGGYWEFLFKFKMDYNFNSFCLNACPHQLKTNAKSKSFFHIWNFSFISSYCSFIFFAFAFTFTQCEWAFIPLQSL